MLSISHPFACFLMSSSALANDILWMEDNPTNPGGRIGPSGCRGDHVGGIKLSQFVEMYMRKTF